MSVVVTENISISLIKKELNKLSQEIKVSELLKDVCLPKDVPKTDLKGHL